MNVRIAGFRDQPNGGFFLFCSSSCIPKGTVVFAETSPISHQKPWAPLCRWRGLRARRNVPGPAARQSRREDYSRGDDWPPIIGFVGGLGHIAAQVLCV